MSTAAKSHEKGFEYCLDIYPERSLKTFSKMSRNKTCYRNRMKVETNTDIGKINLKKQQMIWAKKTKIGMRAICILVMRRTGTKLFSFKYMLLWNYFTAFAFLYF